MGNGREHAYVLGHLQEKSQKIKIKNSFHPLLNGPFKGPMSRVKASPKKKKESKEKKVWLSSFIFIALREEQY